MAAKQGEGEMEKAKTIADYLPFLIPVLLLQLGLAIFCLVDLARRNKTRGPKWLWAIIITFGELVGPLVYLLIGREE
jgi:DMSO reductase anchor subunit